MPRPRAGRRPPAASLYDRLFALSREAHVSGQHEVAYHALVAAMHAAEDAHDVAGVHNAMKEAQAQIAWVDQNNPDHRLSTKSAGRRNHRGVYAMLSSQAETIGTMLQRRK